MSAYPVAFDPVLFPPIAAAVAAKPRPAEKLVGSAPVEVTGALRIPSDGDAVVTALWIESARDATLRSQAFQNHAPSKNAPVDATSHFSFLPGVDDVRIRWGVKRIPQVAEARFELYSARTASPIWTKDYRGDSAIRLLQGADGGGAGPLAWSEVAVTVDPALFPDGCPTVAGAPYQLRLTVTGTGGGSSTAWTYFDVLVQKIELHWGDQALVPAGPIQDVLPIYQALTDRDEKAILAGLRAGGTGIDPAKNLEIRLKSTNASYLVVQEWFAWRDFAFLRFKGRWGDGPRIPVVAKVFLHSLDSSDGVHSTQAAKALGPAEFLWDWRDKTETDRVNEIAGYDVRARTFLTRALKYKENTAGEPPACLNCHVDRGGKRGGTRRVLPEFNSAAAFPFEVVKPGARSWGAFSKALTSGTHACSTGVLFQPSRMAQDSYQLRVFLATGAHKAMLDVAGTMDALVAAHPGLPSAGTGMLEMFRQVDARYIQKGDPADAADLTAVSLEYKKGGVRLIWATNSWTRADFTQLMSAAATPDNTGASRAYQRGAIFETNAAARRKGLTNWTVPLPGTANTVPSPAKAELANYDQWFGCAVGATPPAAPSGANFTLPGRNLVEGPFISQVVDTYINKKRTINDKQRKWKKLKSQNAAVPDAQLRVRFFYDVLSEAERTKLLPDIRKAYEAAGWQGWDVPRDHHEEWVDANYNYKTKKLLYLAEEMHVRKVLADGFEGVTLFHYRHFIDTLEADGSIYGRQCAIGGVAAINLNADLGLSGAFAVWDHPTNHQRQTMQRLMCVRKGIAPMGADGHQGKDHGDCTYKDGNATIVHEFGHFLHLPHAPPMGGGDEQRMHDQADAKCIMNYDPDGLHLCGVCLLRLRGWAYFQSKGQQGFNGSNPDNPGSVPPDPADNVLALLTGFYTDFA